MAKVNGESMNVDGMTVRELITKLNFDETKIVVEKNLEIVPKSSYDTVFVSEADELEVVSFVGGG